MEKLLSVINIILKKKNRALLGVVDNNMNLRNDIGLDSLDLAELTVRLEREFGIDIFEDGLISTIGEVKSRLKIDE